ncbi:MAG: hypothetical protein HRU11_08035 [Parvularculaceae bacterium]|nr:hypothetical protein [Parvularculaceae bacterium]
MSFSITRVVLFSAIGLPVGFVLAALMLAATNSAIDAPAVFPWALGTAVVSGLLGGFWRTREADGPTD